MHKTSRPTAAFMSVVIAGFVLFFVMDTVQPALSAVIFDYNYWFGTMKDNMFFRFLWLIGDGSEPHFHKTLLGGAGLLLGSFIAYYLDKAKSKKAGFPIAYASGLWPWILLASWISLVLSGILFGGIRIEGDAWIPTFVPYVSVASAVVLLYGGSFVNAITGGVLGTLFTTPITMFVRGAFCLPLGLPGVIASVSGMWIGGIIVFEVCSKLSWMQKVPAPKRDDDAPSMPSIEYVKEHKNEFFIRRMLADYSEPVFVGNEIAGACLLIGSILTWALSPMQPFYGTGWFPALLLCQILTGAIAIFVYWPYYVEGDGAGVPSFVPVVSCAPAMVLTFGPSMGIVLIGSVLGALLCPVLALTVNRNIPSHWGGMVGTTFSMAFSSLAVGVLVKFLLLAFPALGV